MPSGALRAPPPPLPPSTCARTLQIGQTKNVTIYRLISRSTIEENILKKAREKRRLGELAIDEAGFTPSFFKRSDNIRDLFNTDDDAAAENAIDERRTNAAQSSKDDEAEVLKVRSLDGDCIPQTNSRVCRRSQAPRTSKIGPRPSKRPPKSKTPTRPTFPKIAR